MKKFALIAVLLLSTLTITFAQSTQTKDRKRSPEQRTEIIMKKLDETLSLDRNQYKQIREIVLAREVKRQDGKLGNSDDVTGKINKYLTKEQKEKWVAYKKDAKQKHHHKKDMKHDHADDENAVKPHQEVK
jgi:hypothetical protein